MFEDLPADVADDGGAGRRLVLQGHVQVQLVPGGREGGRSKGQLNGEILDCDTGELLELF